MVFVFWVSETGSVVVLQNILPGSQEIRDQITGDPKLYFCNFLELYLFFKCNK